MSKSVTFSFTKPPTQYAFATNKHTPTTAVPDDNKNRSQSTPQVKNGPPSAAETLPGSSGVPAVHHKIGKQTPSSVQAETGQLKMDNGDRNATPFTTSSRIKTIYEKGQSPPVNAYTIAEKMRQQSNNIVHEHVRNVKYDLASLHEHLLKLEDEIKLANKGKNALEIAIQDIRRGISVNQQTISAQQKKRREEDSRPEVFLEEARTLSSTKRKLESHFHVTKQQLHSLDSIRKQLQNKISTLSKSSELDAQRFKVYNGPCVKSDDGRPRHYSTASRQSTNYHYKEFLVTVTEAIKTARNTRTGIKELIASAHTTKQQAHAKVTTAITESIDKAKKHQRTICLEKGQLRLQQNAALNQAHKTEIALGIVCGPISDKYKSVALAEDRPLMRSRPASAMEESNCMKNAKTSLTRQLSAAIDRSTSVATTDQRLSQSLKDSSKYSSVDTQLIRVRKMSLDNRWVS